MHSEYTNCFEILNKKLWNSLVLFYQIGNTYYGSTMLSYATTTLLTFVNYNL